MIKVTDLTKENLGDFLNFVEKEEGINKKTAVEYSVNNLLSEEEYLICMDEESKQIIGYSKTTMLPKGILQLDYIFVAQDKRRDTNGSIILVAVYNRAVNRLVAGMICQCEKSNAGANAFLKARGFRVGKEDENVNYYVKSLAHMYIPHKHED